MALTDSKRSLPVEWRTGNFAGGAGDVFFVGEGNQMQNDFDHFTLGDAKSIMLEIIIID